MEDNANTIAALERVLLTVEAELTALHTGVAVDKIGLEDRLVTQLSAQMTPPVAATPTATQGIAPPPPPPLPSAPSQSEPSSAVMAGSIPPPPPPSASAAFDPMTSPLSSPANLRKASKPFSVEQVFRVGGASLVVLAAVFFVSTAISRGWIGPTAQLTLAAAASVAMIAQSFRFSKDRRPWQITMAIGGAAALFVSGVVGHFGLELLDINVTLAWLGATVIGFLLLGRAHDAQSVAAAGTPAAAIGTLLFAATGDATAPVVLGMGTLWALAVLAACWDKRWFGARALGGASAAGIILLGTAIETVTTTTDVGALLGIAAIVALAATQLYEYALAADDGELPLLAQFEARLAAALAPWIALIGSILIAGDLNIFGAEPAGWFAVAIGLGVAAAATVASRHIHPTMTVLHQLAGLGTATAGFVAVLDGPVLIAVLLSQAIISSAIAIRSSSAEMLAGAVLLSIVPTIWTLWQLVEAIGGNAMSAGELAVTGLFVAVVGGITFIVKDRAQTTNAWMLSWVLYLVWIAAALQDVPQNQMAISLVWAASAVSLIVTRHTVWGDTTVARFRSVLNVALATLLVTGAKLVFIDLVAVDVLWRAGLFFLIGGTFLRLAFVLPEMLESEATEQEDTQRENLTV